MKTDACQNDKFAIEVMNSGRCGKVVAPEIQENEEEYGVKEMFPGEELRMECHATGHPEPESESPPLLGVHPHPPPPAGGAMLCVGLRQYPANN